MESIQQYLEYGMYKTLAFNTAKMLDTSIVLLVGICAAFLLLSVICKKLTGWMQKSFFIAGSLGIISGSWNIVSKNVSFLTLAILVYIFSGAVIYFRLYKLRAFLFTFVFILLIPNFTYGLFWIKNALWVSKKPNIIWIMVDALRADHLSCYGYKRETSPNIDILAKGSLVFENVISQSSVTSLSVPSFFLGRYPQAIKEGISLGKLLEDRGYDTASVVANYRCITNDDIRNVVRFRYYDSAPSQYQISSNLVLERSTNWLKNRRKSPFFMFLLFMDVHSPYRKHKGFDFGDKYFSKSPDYIDSSMLKPTAKKLYSDIELKQIKLLYDSSIGFTDERIGQLLKQLKTQGLYDNSIIIFMADHGEEFGEHGQFFHARGLYNEVLHVPLIVKLPKQIKGRRVESKLPLIDLYPSIINSLGIKPNKNLQGHTQDLRTDLKIRDNDIFSAINYKKYTDYRSVICGNLKLIENKTNKKLELYDLKKDPKETINIVALEPKLTNNLYKVLCNKEKELNKNAVHASLKETGYKPTLSKKDKERLRSLGYLQ